MQDSDLLQTVAEVGIAVAGFSGVVAFLGERARGDWRVVDLFRFNNLLSSSIAASLLSFAPILIFRLGASESNAWRCSSGLIAAYMLIELVRYGRGLRRLPEREKVEISPPGRALILAIIVAVLVLQLTAAAGVTYVGESAPVLVGLVWLLAFSAFQFVRLLQMLRLKAGDSA